MENFLKKLGVMTYLEQKKTKESFLAVQNMPQQQNVRLINTLICKWLNLI